MSEPYFIRGQSAAIAATIDHAIVNVRNPGPSWQRLLEIAVVLRAGAPAAGAGFVARRSTDVGSAGAAYGQIADLHARNQAVSPLLLYTGAFAVQPALASGELRPVWVMPAGVTSGVGIILPCNIEIPPLTGLALVNLAAVAFAASEWGIMAEMI